MLHRPTKFRLFQKMSHARDVLCVLLNCFTLLSVHAKRIRWMQFVWGFFFRFLYKYAILQNNQNCSFTCLFQRILQSAVCSSLGSKLVSFFFNLLSSNTCICITIPNVVLYICFARNKKYKKKL